MSKNCKFCSRSISTSNFKRHQTGQHSFCSSCSGYFSRKRHACFQKRICEPEEHIFVWIPCIIKKDCAGFLEHLNAPILKSDKLLRERVGVESKHVSLDEPLARLADEVIRKVKHFQTTTCNSCMLGDFFSFDKHSCAEAPSTQGLLQFFPEQLSDNESKQLELMIKRRYGIS